MINCTGKRCLAQYNKVDPATCPAVSYCPQATPPKTNADRIRSMTDEELEEWLTAFVCSNVAPHATARGAAKKGRLLKWLKEEATDN